jgi:periplasmic protein TonB
LRFTRFDVVVSPQILSQSTLMSEDQVNYGRLAAPPVLGLRHLMGVVVVVPVLLAAGVLWLRLQPADRGVRTNDVVVDVRLVAPTLVQPTPPVTGLPNKPTPISLPKPPTDDPVASTSEQSPPPPPPAPAEASLEPSSAPAARPDPGASASPMPIPADKTVLNFQRRLLAHIERNRHYPDAARPERARGVVKVLFAMRRDGSVDGVRVLATSGNQILDAAAVDTIRRAQPLPPIPAELPDQLTIQMPVGFYLP